MPYTIHVASGLYATDAALIAVTDTLEEAERRTEQLSRSTGGTQDVHIITDSHIPPSAVAWYHKGRRYEA